MDRTPVARTSRTVPGSRSPAFDSVSTRLGGLLVAAVLLGLLLLTSLAVGSKPIPPSDVVAAFTAFDAGSENHGTAAGRPAGWRPPGLRRWSEEDEAAVVAAMVATDIAHLPARPVDELSGGQRQRVWIAMTLAQGTDLLLLDEPTTFLDLAHQVEVLDLLADLNEAEGRTIVLVLHDLNLAAWYSHHLIAMKDGTVVTEGPPAEVVTAETVREVFGLHCLVVPDPVTGTPLVVPLGREGRGSPGGQQSTAGSVA